MDNINEQIYIDDVNSFDDCVAKFEEMTKIMEIEFYCDENKDFYLIEKNGEKLKMRCTDKSTYRVDSNGRTVLFNMHYARFAYAGVQTNLEIIVKQDNNYEICKYEKNITSKDSIPKFSYSQFIDNEYSMIFVTPSYIEFTHGNEVPNVFLTTLANYGIQYPNLSKKIFKTKFTYCGAGAIKKDYMFDISADPVGIKSLPPYGEIWKINGLEGTHRYFNTTDGYFCLDGKSIFIYPGKKGFQFDILPERNKTMVKTIKDNNFVMEHTNDGYEKIMKSFSEVVCDADFIECMNATIEEINIHNENAMNYIRDYYRPLFDGIEYYQNKNAKNFYYKDLVKRVEEEKVDY